MFLAALLLGSGAGVVPVPVAAAYCAMSVVAFVLYFRDKRAARAGRARTRERTLHVADLLGGWPGGLLAQDRLRHKTRKVSFQLVFWATVAAHGAVIAWFLASGHTPQPAAAADAALHVRP